jgi:hypothetical protein
MWILFKFNPISRYSKTFALIQDLFIFRLSFSIKFCDSAFMIEKHFIEKLSRKINKS